MPVFAPYSRFSAILGRFFGDYFFWAIEPAQKLHGILDLPAAYFFVINMIINMIQCSKKNC